MAILIEPERYDLPPKGDVVDFLASEGSIQRVIDNYAPALKAHQNGQTNKQAGIQAVIDTVPMTTPETAIYPGTYNLQKLDTASLKTIWWAVTGLLPKSCPVDDLKSQLMHKGHTKPDQVFYRRHALHNAVYIRLGSDQPTYLISAEGVKIDRDPSDGLLLTPGQPHYPTEVDLQGSYENFETFRKLLGLSLYEAYFLMVSWIAALTNQPAPGACIK